MLIGLGNFHHFRVLAKDGEVGRVAGFEFDDQDWKVRFMVIDATRTIGKKILVNPASVTEDDLDGHILRLRVDRNRLAMSPEFEAQVPVNHYGLIARHETFKWPFFWTGAGIFGSELSLDTTVPQTVPRDEKLEARERERVRKLASRVDPHLAEVEELAGFKIHTIDGDTFGALNDLVVDDRTWRVHYLVADLRRWFPGQNVLVPPARVESIDWMRKRVNLDVDHEALRSAPRVDEHEPVSLEKDAEAQAFYLGLPGGKRRATPRQAG